MSDYLFDDLLVIDCASFIAAPAAATMLADLGARVIKIEPPGEGDGYRQMRNMEGLPRGERDYAWHLTNRSKEGLALDLKQPAARDALDKLIARADVFITNYPLGVRARLRLEYEDIRAVNPRAIYASLTPYGETGPEADHTGYDATAWWARSGLMDLVRASPDTPPAVSMPGMGDHMAGCSLYGAIVTGLYRRQKTGEGCRVGSSLLANGLWSNGVMVQAALDGADLDTRMDRKNLGALTQTYRCADDRWFLLVLLPQVQQSVWPKLARCMGHPEWIDDPRFVGARERDQNKLLLTELFTEVFRARDWEYWRQNFADQGITCGRIARVEDIREDRQAQAGGLLTAFADGDRTVDSPLYIEGARKRQPALGPGVGEHAAAILREFGIDPGAIAGSPD